MKYIKNIILGLVIGCFLGFLLGTIFESKVSKANTWERKQKTQQIIFSILGSIGGIVIGYKISEEDSKK
jgi:NhaP-type Na+/H+ or K+/H+ antiporter